MITPWGRVVPLGENGFITFRRLSIPSPVRPGPLTAANLTATIAWRLTANNRADRQTHRRNTAVRHKPLNRKFHTSTTSNKLGRRRRPPPGRHRHKFTKIKIKPGYRMCKVSQCRAPPNHTLLAVIKNTPLPDGARHCRPDIPVCEVCKTRIFQRAGAWLAAPPAQCQLAAASRHHTVRTQNRTGSGRLVAGGAAPCGRAWQPRLDAMALGLFPLDAPAWTGQANRASDDLGLRGVPISGGTGRLSGGTGRISGGTGRGHPAGLVARTRYVPLLESPGGAALGPRRHRTPEMARARPGAKRRGGPASRGAEGYSPAWVRSWSALSVRSQVKPSPLRPKWP